MFGVWGPLKGLFLPACKHHHLITASNTEQRVCPVASMQKKKYKPRSCFQISRKPQCLRGVFVTLWHVYHSDLKCAAARPAAAASTAATAPPLLPPRADAAAAAAGGDDDNDAATAVIAAAHRS